MFRRPLYICFIDLKKAYDSVQCAYLLPHKLLSIIRALHEDPKAAVRAYGKTSDEFAVTSGVRQGCVLAPTNLYFDAAIRTALDHHHSQGRGVRVVYLHDAKLVGNRRKLQLETLVTDLEYADDMTLIADSWEDLKSMLKSLEVRCRDMGLTITSKKTKTLAVLPDNSHPKPEPISLHPDDVPLEVVSNFQYLGSIVQDNCDSSVEVDPRISKASRAFRQLSHILWYQRKIRTRTKLRMFNSAILPIFLYSLECTVLLEAQLHNLQSFVMQCLRIILGVSVWEMKHSTAIRKMAKQHRLSSILTQRRLRFLDHLSRMCGCLRGWWCVP